MYDIPYVAWHIAARLLRAFAATGDDPGPGPGPGPGRSAGCRRAQRPADAGRALPRRPGLLPAQLAAATAGRPGADPGAPGVRGRGVPAGTGSAADPAADRDRAGHRRLLPGAH